MKLFIILVSQLIGTALCAQNFEWARSLGGSSNEFTRSVSVDSAGNVYSTGSFAGTVDFDPGPGTTNLTSNGQIDIFVQKMDAGGNFLWVRAFGSSSFDQGFSIFVDEWDNVYATGSFQGTVDFDPGPGTTNLTSSGFDDVFILKLDENGNFLWARSFGNNENGIGYSIAVDQSGNVLTTGYFRGIVDFDPGPGIANLTGNINDDVFVLKLNSSGDFIWARAFGSTGQDDSRSVAVDAVGNVYTSGSFQGTVDFDPGPGTLNLTAVGGLDAFIHKMDPQGNFLWVSPLGGTSSDKAYSTAIDHSGNVVTTGYFAGTVDFDPGPGTTNLSTTGGADSDVFVQKMDSLGNFIWARSFSGIDVTAGHSINVDSINNVYTTGYFQETVDFDPGVNTSNLISNGSHDAFIQKMDSLGEFSWAVSFGSSGFDQALSIGLDYVANVYTGGFYIGTCDFDPGAGTTNLTSAGSNDGFIQKLGQCSANSGTDIVTACDSYMWIDGNTYATSNNSATFTLTNTAGCDSIVTLDLTILNSTSGTDVQTACDPYTWIDENTYATSNNTATFTLTNAAGCDSVVTLNLTINSVSDITTSISGVTITANNASATYQWLDCDNNIEISGETGQTYTATTNGNYAVELVENGCVDTSDCVTISTVGIIKNDFGNAFKIFPNPTQGKFSIDLGNVYQNVTISITDISGRLVESRNITQAQMLQYEVDTPNGIYIISIQAGGKHAVIRLIKE